TLDATGCFGLTTIKNPAKPGEDGCEGHQPGCERGHEANEIADGFVGDSLGLFDHRDPSSRWHRTERVKHASAFEVSAFVSADFLRHDRLPRRRRAVVRPKIVREQRLSRLIENLAGRLVRELDRGKTEANPLH